MEGATSDRLMDTAERLFGLYGFDGVGMRALAEEAGVNLGATTYHYGSKERLYLETFFRRFRPANLERLELLRKAEAAAGGRPLPLDTIVDCMVRPPFRTVLSHPHFAILIARNLFFPPAFLEMELMREMQPNIEAFLAAMAKSLPEISPGLIHLREMFSMGSVLMFAANMGRMFPEVALNPEAFEWALKELVRFISAGLQAKPATASVTGPLEELLAGKRFPS